jgi:glutathione-regulated potassium-efflux system ancillary protein KefF
MPRILVIVAHPRLEHSRVTRRLMASAQACADQGLDLEVRDLYARYPDYLIDTDAERAALAGVQLQVWLHPIHWYAMPPLMKLWLDEVYGFGWAYGPDGEALQGQDLWLSTSTGGTEDSYHSAGHNRYFFDAFMPPYDQTAALTGMRFLPPLVLHGAHRVSEAALATHAAMFAERLRSWPAWPEIDALADIAPCDVPRDARPVEATAEAIPGEPAGGRQPASV